MSDIPPTKLESPSLGIVNDDLTITFKRDLSYCVHAHIVVDGGKRTVECGKCKKLMDPYDALASLARDSANLVDERKQLRADVERWRKEAEDARRQRANAIAARKRVESPEAALLREFVADYAHRECKHEGETAPRFCMLCRMRAVVGRNDKGEP